MRVLFLDIDGVLNSEQFFRANSSRPGAKSPSLRSKASLRKLIKWRNLTHISEYLFHSICPIAAANLRYLLETYPDINIVISSTWRLHYSLADIADVLKFHGIPNRIIDKTPELDGVSRGQEIKTWLRDHPEVKKVAIVDDNSDMDDLKHVLVKTSGFNGLTLEDAMNIATLLGSEVNMTWGSRLDESPYNTPEKFLTYKQGDSK